RKSGPGKSRTAAGIEFTNMGTGIARRFIKTDSGNITGFITPEFNARFNGRTVVARTAQRGLRGKNAVCHIQVQHIHPYLRYTAAAIYGQAEYITALDQSGNSSGYCS